MPPSPARSIRSLVPSWTVRARLKLGKRNAELTPAAVKFDTEQIPAILNAIETENNGTKLVLEVAVREIWRWT